MISLRNQIKIQWFFIPWICLRVLFPKISNCLISITILSSDLVKFKEIFRNYLNSLWIQPLFTNIPLNSWFNLKIGEFGYYFDSWPCVFNDLTVSTCHTWQSHMFPRGTIVFVRATSSTTLARDEKKILFILIQNKLNQFIKNLEKFQKKFIKIRKFLTFKYNK